MKAYGQGGDRDYTNEFNSLLVIAIVTQRESS